MSEIDESKLLALAAARAERRPEYLASAFREYRVARGISEAGFAAEIGADPSTFADLKLCLRPRPEFFEQDLNELDGRFKVNKLALAQVLRLVEALATFARPAARATESVPGFILAARTVKQKKSGNKKKQSRKPQKGHS